MNTPEIFANQYLGPEMPIGVTRRNLLFSSNKAASYVPSYLLTCAEGQYSVPVELLVHKPLVTAEVLEELKEDMKIHMEQRIHLFFQKLLLTYKTKLCFHPSAHAELQVGQVKDVKGDNYVAAHHDTLQLCVFLKM